MAVSKKYLKTKPVCKVTFAHKAPEVNELCLVGDFNEWDSKATPLKKLKNGTFKTVIDLDIEKSYEYRFIADGKYINDSEAESLVFNKYANAQNCLITV